MLAAGHVSSDENAEYLSDGITENLSSTRLSPLPQLRVMAHSAVRLSNGREVTRSKPDRELNVRAVLTGRVLQVGDLRDYQTELVDVANGWQTLGRAYDRPPQTSSPCRRDCQKHLRQVAAQALKKEKNNSPSDIRRTVSLSSLSARGVISGTSQEQGLLKSIEYFNQAIEETRTTHWLIRV